jgi:hypothetical protein
MFHPTFSLSRATIVSMVVLAIAVVFCSFSIVRAQRASFAGAQRVGLSPGATTKDSCSSGTACVEGNSTGSSTVGVYGTSSADDGVYGQTRAKSKSGIIGLATGSGYWGVYAASNDTTGHGAALRAQALQSATNIFFGHNKANNASCGIDPNADLTCTGSLTSNIANSTGNPGVSGSSRDGYGVQGSSLSTSGVYGTTTAASSGVLGAVTTSGATGVYGSNEDNGNGVVAESGDTTGHYDALYAQADASSTWIFFGGNEANEVSCAIDPDADLGCSGKIQGADVQVRRVTRSGQHVLAYGSESTSATIEDFGTARMYAGVANVSFGRDFASTIDRNSQYYVFLTPLGDTRGLYVSIKTPSGFQVRETEHGRSSLAFDYRIVARPLGAKSDRLPLAPAMRTPPPMHRTH